MPKVSIIIPVYNVEQYLHESMDSMLNQTLSDIELICVDDCSTDGSFAILEDYAKKDKRVRIFHLEENKGQGFARNFALEKVTGEYIGFVDPDDWIEPDMYETLYNYAQEYEVDLVDSHYILHKEHSWGTEIEYYKGKLEHPKNQVFDKDWNTDYIFAPSVGPCGKIYKTNFIKTNNITFGKGRFAEDQIFVIKSRYFAEKIFFCPEHLYHYRIRKGSSSDIGIGENTHIRIESLTEIKTFLEEQEYFQKTKKHFWKFVMTRIVSTYQRCPNKYKKNFDNEVKKFLPRKQYLKYKRQKKYYKNFVERIFSIKKMQLLNDKFKILTIFGIKIKLKKYVR